MRKEHVSQSLFHPPRCAQKAATPNVPENTYQHTDSNDVEGINQKTAEVNFENRQIIDCPFNYPRNKELQHINNNQTDDADENGETIFYKIGLY